MLICTNRKATGTITMTELLTDKIIKKLKSSKGMSLGELLVALLIVLLVTSGVTSGMQLALAQYDKSMIRSEGMMLCSTLENIITDELGSTGSMDLSTTVDANGYKEVLRFRPKNYSRKDVSGNSAFYSVKVDSAGNISTLDEGSSGYGELFLGNEDSGTLKGNLLINSAAYSTYDLGAKVDVRYDETKHIFHVALDIADKREQPVLHEDFDVIHLNRSASTWSTPVSASDYSIYLFDGNKKIDGFEGTIKKTGDDYSMTLNGWDSVIPTHKDGNDVWTFEGWFGEDKKYVPKPTELNSETAKEFISHDKNEDHVIRLYAGYTNTSLVYTKTASVTKGTDYGNSYIISSSGEAGLAFALSGKSIDTSKTYDYLEQTDDTEEVSILESLYYEYDGNNSLVNNKKGSLYIINNKSTIDWQYGERTRFWGLISNPKLFLEDDNYLFVLDMKTHVGSEDHIRVHRFTKKYGDISDSIGASRDWEYYSVNGVLKLIGTYSFSSDPSKPLLYNATKGIFDTSDNDANHVFMYKKMKEGTLISFNGGL